MTCPTRRMPAFTLIEILVALTIAAVLCVLLSGALASARNSARQAQCMGNLRNLGVGLIAFAVRNKNYGMPGAPNAFCNSADITVNVRGLPGQGDSHGQEAMVVNSAQQQAGAAPNTLWTSTPQTGDLQVYNLFLPNPGYTDSTGRRASRFVNHGFLFKYGLVNDERVYNCPDIEGLYTGLDNDPNGFDRTLRGWTTNPEPGDAPLTPAPAAPQAWMSSYDYRSCYDPNVQLQNGAAGASPDDFRGPYGPLNLARMGSESPVFADTIQNPAGLRKAHDNRRYNVCYADGRAGVFFDDAAASTLALKGGPAFPTSPLTGQSVDTIASMGLSIAATQNYWYWNERVWAQLLSNP